MPSEHVGELINEGDGSDVRRCKNAYNIHLNVGPSLARSLSPSLESDSICIESGEAHRNRH